MVKVLIIFYIDMSENEEIKWKQNTPPIVEIVYPLL